MLGSTPLVAFSACADLDRAHAFYGGLLGLTTVDRSEFANVYDAAGTQLRVTQVPQPARAAYTILGWQVDDVAAEVTELSAAGVEFLRYPGIEQDELGIWRSPSGARIAWFADPDGNTLSLQQLVA